MGEKIGSVLVVGGGVAGIQTSLDLSKIGFKVYLVEDSPAVGGETIRLGCLACKPCHTYFSKEKEFMKISCGRCSLPQMIDELRYNKDIILFTNSRIQDVSGEAGSFDVSILRTTRFVNEARCTICGACEERCQVEVEDLVHGKRKAVYLPYPDAAPLSYVIDRDACNRCGECVDACKSGAVNLHLGDETVKIKAGTIVISCGFEGFDPNLAYEYGYKRYPNVLSSLDFERLLDPRGISKGELRRPSDGGIPKRIAWIQCVGSRDLRFDRPFCSSVCCSYAVKQAIVAKGQVKDGLETTIFYMDMRIFAKGLGAYLNRARDEYGVRFMRGRVAEVVEIDGSKGLRLYSEMDGGELVVSEFDMVVLSTGFRPAGQVSDLARRLGIELNKYGFCRTSSFSPLETSSLGVYVAGAFQAPKDISDTIIQASGAAAASSAFLAEARGKEVSGPVYPPERDIRGKEPRIGVFVCHCGGGIAGWIDIQAVVEYVKTLSGVVYVEGIEYACFDEAMNRIEQKICKEDLNRVVIAGCSPRLYGPLFQEVVRKAGLNPYLLEIVNIRDQCSFVHGDHPDAATRKAKTLLRMAVAKLHLAKPLRSRVQKVRQDALVIGGGLAGMTSALLLARQGFKVHLVEAESELGGNLRRLRFLLDGEDPKKKLQEFMRLVTENKNVEVYTNTRVSKIEGSIGAFRTILNGGEREISHGVVIIATGAREYRPTEYLYGQDERVITQLELEERLTEPQSEIRNSQSIVMIQCVGSRDEDRQYCSRVCCSQAVKNAIKIMDMNPAAQIYILYRDMSTYGFKEGFFGEARQRGVIFIQYEDTERPHVTKEGDNLRVEVKDRLLGAFLLIEPDLLVLSPAIVPNDGNLEISEQLKIPLTENGFFLEAHTRLQPVDTVAPGVFICGLAHGPKSVDESLSQAAAAASRAAGVISKGEIALGPILSFVLDENCDGCAYCVDPCPFNAIALIEYMKEGVVKKTVDVDETRCKGCGVCMATCPKKGIYVEHFKLEMLQAMVEAALQPV